MKPGIWTMWALNVNYWVYSNCDSHLRFIYLFIYVFKTATEM